MTFDGSPQHTRHGVGGFPKVPEQPSRARRLPATLTIIAVVVLAAMIVIAAVLIS